jgi:hypothetical protein
MLRPISAESFQPYHSGLLQHVPTKKNLDKRWKTDYLISQQSAATFLVVNISIWFLAWPVKNPTFLLNHITVD